MNEELKINPVFRDKIPPLTEEEFKKLEENIVSDGVVRDPLVTWNGTIIDGHNRWKIILKHPEIPYTVKEMDFADEWAAIAWMCGNQLGRRNVSDEQKTYLLGKLYEARKNTYGASDGFRGNQHTELVSAQNGHIAKPRISEQIAKEQGVGKETVKRAEHFANSLDAAEEVSPGFRDKVLAGEIKVTKSAIESLRNMDEAEKAEAVAAIADGTYKAAKKKQTEAERDISAIYEEMTNKEREIEYTVDDFIEELGLVVSDFERKVSRMFQNNKTIVRDNAAAVCEVLDGAVKYTSNLMEEI